MASGLSEETKPALSRFCHSVGVHYPSGAEEGVPVLVAELHDDFAEAVMLEGVAHPGPGGSPFLIVQGCWQDNPGAGVHLVTEFHKLGERIAEGGFVAWAVRKGRRAACVASRLAKVSPSCPCQSRR